MHTPTKAQFQTVIENLNRAVNDYGAADIENFDMGQGDTTDPTGAICSTVHCIGGWYAIATLQPFKTKVNYVDGAKQMAADLGFEDYRDLKGWAFRNPVIWGNQYGYAMFSDEGAYNYAHTLPQAIAHLESVRDRLSE